MRKLMLLALVVLLLLVMVPLPASGDDHDNGASVDRANDCFFPIIFPAFELRVQKVKTSVDSGQFHCHGIIDDPEAAPPEAFVLSGPGCTLPFFFGDREGFGRLVVTPDGHINLTCRFSQP